MSVKNIYSMWVSIFTSKKKWYNTFELYIIITIWKTNISNGDKIWLCRVLFCWLFISKRLWLKSNSLNEWLPLLKSCLHLSAVRDEGTKQSKHKVCCAEQKVRKNSFVMIRTHGPLVVFYLTRFPFIQETYPVVHE